MKHKKILAAIFTIIIAASLFQNTTFSVQKVIQKASIGSSAQTIVQTKPTTPSTVASSNYAKENAYNLLIKANIADIDYAQHIIIKQNDKIISIVDASYSKTYDCMKAAQDTNIVYVNNLHNPKKIEYYISHGKGTPIKTDTQALIKSPSYKNINRFISYEDSILKDIINNSKITLNNNTIIINSNNLPNKILKEIQKSSNVSMPISAFSITITLSNSKMVSVNQELVFSGIHLKTIYTISYGKQNIKPFKK